MDQSNKLKSELIKYLKDIDEDTNVHPYLIKKSVDNPATNSTMTVPEVSDKLDKKEKLLILEKKVKECKNCLLGLSRINAVFGVGNPYAKVMFVGEGPGYEEDHKGEPFVGKAGQLLDKILASINLSRETVYIANIVKCHPMINPETPHARGNDRPPSPEEISACRVYIEEQIKIIKPACVVALGNVAARFLLNEKKGISQLRGRFYDSPSDFYSFDYTFKILPTYHPAALLRNPSLKRETWEDMKMLKAFLEDLK